MEVSAVRETCGMVAISRPARHPETMTARGVTSSVRPQPVERAVTRHQHVVVLVDAGRTRAGCSGRGLDRWG